VVHGPPCSGKTALARAALDREGFRVVVVPSHATEADVSEIVDRLSSSPGTVLDMLEQVTPRRAVIVDGCVPPAAVMRLSRRAKAILFVVTAERACRRAFACIGTRGATAGAALPESAGESAGCVAWMKSAARGRSNDACFTSMPDSMTILLVLGEMVDHLSRPLRVCILEAVVLAGSCRDEDIVSALAEAAIGLVLSSPADRASMARHAAFPRCFTLFSMRARRIQERARSGRDHETHSLPSER
jgi:hypothetical protein